MMQKKNLKAVGKPITLRNLPREVALRIQRKAEQDQISLNKAVIHLLQDRLGLREEKKSSIHHDLDPLAGSWTTAEARLFDEALRKQRKIEPEIWE